MSLRGVKSVRVRAARRGAGRRVRGTAVSQAASSGGSAPVAGDDSLEMTPEKDAEPLRRQREGRCRGSVRLREPPATEDLDSGLAARRVERRRRSRSDSPTTNFVEEKPGLHRELRPTPGLEPTPTSDWVQEWQERGDSVAGTESPSLDSVYRGEPRSPSTNSPVDSPASLESLKSALKEFDPGRVYLAHVCHVDWKDLPGRRSPRSERVWVVGAADQEGRHRTRLLVAGRHWRPRCLRRVNMLTQPVVYAGGGRGALTPDLFLWWFHHEFATAATAMHPDGAVLVAERADYLPPESDCVTADGLVRLVVVPPDCLDPRAVTKELRVRLAANLLSSCVLDVRRGAFELDLVAHVKRFTLKEAFVGLHRAWLNVRPETFTRSWSALRGDSESRRSPWLSSTRFHCNLQLGEHPEDRMLLEELQGLARDVGLDVDEANLAEWIEEETCYASRDVLDVIRVKNEPHEEAQLELEDGNRDGGKLEDNPVEDSKPEDKEQRGEYSEEEDEICVGEESCTAEEATKLLSRVLMWMESEPFDPGLLLAVRSIRDTAVLVVSTVVD